LGTSIIDLDQYPAPDLVIEIANTSLSDDIGQKRLLYEDLGVAEYWVVDVVNIRIIAFTITSAGGSQRITESQVLPGLAISMLVEALQRSRQENQSLVGAWLLSQFQQ
jgi:Uma2 family endonuclease